MSLLSPSSPPIGGRYQIVRYVGAGGMQHVYEAQDELFRRSVALKVPKDSSGVRRFQSSAVVSARVNHANVAKTLDYVEDGTGNYLIEEFVDGADLGKVVPDEVPILPPSTVAKIFQQLAKGLAASHHAGVIHRDLKPSNIMVLGGHHFSGIKITDFGIAKMAEAEIGHGIGPRGNTTSKTVIGAIPYMAPESITDFKNASFASDVWAIAAIMYELLSGKQPFGQGLLSVPNILNAVPPPPPQQIAGAQFKSLGEEIMAIILSCFAKNGADRPTADQLCTTLDGLCFSVDAYELGTINHKQSMTVGFITADHGPSVMYHTASFYGGASVSVGDRVWFARHPGKPSPRAFPLVKVPLKP
ncbi:serine/threonine-protein kinase [Sphingomonas sp. Root1294]|nr:serine/threonine-protein kinase [Sphingomonas sp. Root1294]